VELLQAANSKALSKEITTNKIAELEAISFLLLHQITFQPPFAIQQRAASVCSWFCISKPLRSLEKSIMRHVMGHASL